LGFGVEETLLLKEDELGLAKSADVKTGKGEGAGAGVEVITTGTAGDVDPGSALTNVGWILRFLGVGCSLARLMTESPSRSVLNEIFGDSAGEEADVGDCVAIIEVELVNFPPAGVVESVD